MFDNLEECERAYRSSGTSIEAFVSGFFRWTSFPAMVDRKAYKQTYLAKLFMAVTA